MFTFKILEPIHKHQNNIFNGKLIHTKDLHKVLTTRAAWASKSQIVLPFAAFRGWQRKGTENNLK